VQEHRDIFGSAVHTANRMTSQAKAKQIITTLATVERLSPEWQSTTRQIDIATVRGKADEVVLFEVLWSTDEATSMLPTVGHGRPKTGARAKRLSLRYQGREVTLGEGRKSATLGRAEDNDVVVKGNLISRVHARVEVSRDKFTLIDESTNGTFVQTSAGEEIFVRRDSTQLTGEGRDRSRPRRSARDRARGPLRHRRLTRPRAAPLIERLVQLHLRVARAANSASRPAAASGASSRHSSATARAA
jgi:hypothetical protein